MLGLCSLLDCRFDFYSCKQSWDKHIFMSPICINTAQQRETLSVNLWWQLERFKSSKFKTVIQNCSHAWPQLSVDVNRDDGKQTKGDKGTVYWLEVEDLVDRHTENNLHNWYWMLGGRADVSRNLMWDIKSHRGCCVARLMVDRTQAENWSSSSHHPVISCQRLLSSAPFTLLCEQSYIFFIILQLFNILLWVVTLYFCGCCLFNCKKIVLVCLNVFIVGTVSSTWLYSVMWW